MLDPIPVFQQTNDIIEATPEFAQWTVDTMGSFYLVETFTCALLLIIIGLLLFVCFRR